MGDEKRYRILIVEDTKMFLDLGMGMLLGHDCKGATTKQEGIAVFKSFKPDICFLDITLPDGSGHDLLKEIRNINPEAFAVMLTGSSLKKDVEQAVSHGANGYIVKPFSRSQIRECLEKYAKLTEVKS